MGGLAVSGPLFVGWPVGGVFYLLFYSLGISLVMVLGGSGWAGGMIWLVYLRGVAVIFLFFVSALPAPEIRNPAVGNGSVALVLGGCGIARITRVGGQSVNYLVGPVISSSGGGLVIVFGGVLLITILICARQRFAA